MLHGSRQDPVLHGSRQDTVFHGSRSPASPSHPGSWPLDDHLIVGQGDLDGRCAWRGGAIGFQTTAASIVTNSVTAGYRVRIVI